MSCRRSATRADRPGAACAKSTFEGPRFRISPDSNRLAYRAFLNDFTQINGLFLSLLTSAPLHSAPPGN